MKPYTLPVIAFLAALLLSVHGAPITIYQDDFSGGAGDLNGQAPDTGTGNWVAASMINADGTIVDTGVTTSTQGGSATLAFTPQQGRVYTLDVSMTTNGPAGDQDWIGVGFADGRSGTITSNNRFLNDPGASNPTYTIGRAWMYVRADPAATTHNALMNGSVNSVAWSPTTATGGSIDMRVVLDTTLGAGNWTATWYAKWSGNPEYTVVRATADVLTEDITSVGFCRSNEGAIGDVTFFKLSSLSESIPPELATVDPLDNATQVPIGSNLVANFNESVTWGTGNITLRRTSDNSTVETFDVATSPQLAFGTNSVTINPSNDLVGGVEYHLLIDPTAIMDLVGNAYVGIGDPTFWSFTADATPPSTTAFGPLADATDVSPLTGLTLTFGEAVAAGTGNITIHRASDGAVVQTIDVTSGDVVINGSSVTIRLSQLLGATAYYVNMPAGSFVDTSGNAFAGITGTTAWAFTTAPIPLGLLFSDNFDGSSGDIHGTTPDVTTAAATWVAAEQFDADGLIVDSTGGGIRGGSATLAFTPFNGLIYTLDASFTGVSGGINWLALGFVSGQSTAVGANNRFLSVGTIGKAWMLYRGDTTSFPHAACRGSATVGDVDPVNFSTAFPNPDVPSGSSIDLRVVLDTTSGAGAWTVTWYAKRPADASYTVVRSTTTLLSETINAVGIAKSNNVITGTIESFTLTALEPVFAPPLLTITPATPPATGFVLQWDSMAGKLYNVRTRASLDIAIPGWDLLSGNIVATPPSNILPVPADGPRRFYAVEEFDAPP